MITAEKINIYLKYRGDIDAWARLAKNREAKIMTDSDWQLIDDFIQITQLVESGKASNGFEEKLKRNLEVGVSKDEALKMIYKLARKS